MRAMSPGLGVWMMLFAMTSGDFVAVSAVEIVQRTTV